MVGAGGNRAPISDDSVPLKAAGPVVALVRRHDFAAEDEERGPRGVAKAEGEGPEGAKHRHDRPVSDEGAQNDLLQPNCADLGKY